MNLLKQLFLLTVLVTISPITIAENLTQVYQHALKHDPVLKASEASHQATIENRPLALSALKPQVNLSGSTSYNIAHNNNTLQDGFSNFYNAGYTLSVKKPLYRKDLRANVNQANAIIQQSKAALENTQQQLFIRVADVYFAHLIAIESLNFAQSEKETVGRQLAQVKAYFEAGRSPITDVKEAQARYDSSVSQYVAAHEQVDITKEQLRAITGRYYKRLSAAPFNAPLNPPQPNSAMAWEQIALANNLEIKTLQQAVQVAQYEVEKQRMAKKPTVDAFAQHRGSFNRFDNDTETFDAAIGIQLNIPLSTGGAIKSRVRQARASLRQARFNLEAKKRQVVQEARSAYLRVISGIAQAKALKQAHNSTETAAKATRVGFEVGTRTAVDVLVSVRETYRAKRDYTNARYQFFTNILRLKQAAGTLSIKDFQQMSRLLTR